MNRFRQPALIALWLQVAATFGVAAYAISTAHDTLDAVINGGEAFLAGLVLAWWTGIFGRLMGHVSVPNTDGTFRALGTFFPVLTALRGSLWVITLLAMLSGVADTANPVALTALMTLWGGAIVTSNAVFTDLLQLAQVPAEARRAVAERLSDWLNLAAALSLAMTVMNVVPVKGYGDAPSQTSQLVYGAAGALDVVATLLAFLALREMLQSGPSESRPPEAA